MDEAQIYSALNEVFRDVFDDDDITVGPESTAEDIDGWDSQAHIALVIATETRFGVRFRTSEFESMTNVGDFVALIRSKRGDT